MKTGNDRKYYGKILYVLFMVFALLINGCSGGEYEAEKLLWQANKCFAGLKEDLESAAPEDYEEVVLAFRKIVFKFPKWKYSSRAQLTIGQLYALQNNMPKAKTEFAKVLEEFPQDVNTCASALFSIGKICEEENNWNKALKNYKKIVSDYPETYAAYQVPLYIAQYYKAKNMNKKSEAAYKEAIEGYEEVIKEHPDTFASLTAQKFIIAALIEQKKWSKAAEHLQNQADAYPGTPLAVESLCKVAVIYQEELPSRRQAETAYKKAVEEYEKILEESRKYIDAQGGLDQLQSIEAEKTLKGYAVSSLKYITSAAISLKKWDDAIRYFQELADLSPKTPVAAQSLITSARIYHEQLNQPQKAIDIYKYLLENYKGIKAEVIEEKIASLQEAQKE
ncbi:MAG: tetratricopeptide repeat protein [Candidatus Auribacterota bacterium]|nr:tetratricopeptide repeat protein [Candidatus Auribacterota bacterium]